MCQIISLGMFLIVFFYELQRNVSSCVLWTSRNSILCVSLISMFMMLPILMLTLCYTQKISFYVSIYNICVHIISYFTCRKEDGEATGAFFGVSDLTKTSNKLHMLFLFLKPQPQEQTLQQLKIHPNYFP